MIEIVTLFLALVHGPQPVELDVHPDVTAVEIVLDGEPVERLESPPWSTSVDFGTGLRSHRLEAVAFDDEDREIDRAVRFVNLGHRRQAGRMVLLEDKAGRPEAVSLGWESVGQRQPVQVEVSFDGEPVEVDNPRRVRLPDYDVDEFHFVSAVLHFEDGGTDRMEVGFGGQLGLEVSSELTAVSVLPVGDAKPPEADDLATAFRLRDGRALRVHGVEKGRAEVVIVRDAGVQSHFDRLVAWIGGTAQAGAWQRGTLVRMPASVSGFGLLPPKSRLRLLAPRAAPLMPVGVTPDMFLVSPTVDTRDRGLLAASVEEPPQVFDKQVPSAVSLAGLVAHGTNRPRAVVLILGEGGRDVSTVSARSARDYLRDLGVPFFVWAFDPVPRDSDWGPVESLGPPDDLREVRRSLAKAVGRLSEHLKNQRLVWLEGSYLPREIQLSPSAAEVLEFARGEVP